MVVVVVVVAAVMMGDWELVRECLEGDSLQKEWS